MQQSFTKKFMEDHSGCYSLSKLSECSFMKSEPITLESILTSEIPFKDKFWFICKHLATKEENQKIAIRLAEIALPIYEKRYPDNKAPREAIESAKAFIAGTIGIDELLKKRHAAYAATYAAAAYAAYAAAAYAAYAAADAADAAADAAAYAAAAYAAADAAAADAAAADAAYAAADAAADAAAYAAADAAAAAADAAAYAATDAAAAAADAATDADIKKELNDYLMSFVESVPA